jgi:hypothetical protein
MVNQQNTQKDKQSNLAYQNKKQDNNKSNREKIKIKTIIKMMMTIIMVVDFYNQSWKTFKDF